MQDFIDGKIDAFLAGTAEPQNCALRRISRPHDRQHRRRPSVVAVFLLHGRRQRGLCGQISGGYQACPACHPQGRRLLRFEPELAAQALVDRGFLPNYDYALATLKETPHDKWRDYDAEDSVRFYALRMQETGMIKSSPQQILANGTDWHFLNELKRELKG